MRKIGGICDACQTLQPSTRECASDGAHRCGACVHDLAEQSRRLAARDSYVRAMSAVYRSTLRGVA